MELADWLDASLIQSDWRPVPLKEGVYFKKQVKYNDGSTEDVPGEQKKAVERLIQLSIADGGQSLVFVNTRRSTVSLATQLSSLFSDTLSDDDRVQLHKYEEKIHGEFMENTSFVKALSTCLQSGVAFHNAGLSSIQKKVVEEGFKQGAIKCIVATPTLAAGVNIPARYVIIRDLFRYDANFGMVPIPILEYKQQAGRAGRPGYDSIGKAITIAKNSAQQDQLYYNYTLADTEPIYSKLGTQAALRMHLLAGIAAGYMTNDDAIATFIDSTFYSYQSDIYAIEHEIEQALNFLVENGFLDPLDDGYMATLFGLRTSSLYIDPLSALTIKQALEKAPDREVIALSYLHAICSTPDVRSLYLRESDGWVEEQAENHRRSLLLDVPTIASTDYEWFLSDLKTALLLNDWIEELPYDHIVNKYNIWPGDIHNTVEIAEWLLHGVREIARMYHFSHVTDITDVVIRVHHGCKQELLNLIQLPGIGRVRARALYNQGFHTINDLRGVPIDRISSIPTIGTAIAQNIVQQIGEEKQHRNQMIGKP